MKRRSFLAGAAGLAATPAMHPLDYGRSFLSGKAEWNRVRFWVESRTRIIDERAGRFEDYLQCASCKSEDTFAKQNLFLKDNYDFLPIFGPEFGVIFRRKAVAHPGYREVRPSAKMWDGQTIRLQPARKARRLETTAAIRRATHEGVPLVAQVEIRGAEAGLRAILEFPVKTMNIHDSKDLYQVDTGPVALPDLSRRPEKLVDCVSLAFVAFNAPVFADFVVEGPTPAGAGLSVNHYAAMHHSESANSFFAIS